MNNEVKETVLKAAEYNNEKKARLAKVVVVFFVIGIIGVIVNQFLFMMELPSTFGVGFIKGISAGMPIGAMILGLSYMFHYMIDLKKEKERIISK